MTWNKINPYTITNGTFNITRHPKPEMVPLPYGLWQLEPRVMLGHYKDADSAKAAATGMSASKNPQAIADMFTNQDH